MGIWWRAKKLITMILLSVSHLIVMVLNFIVSLIHGRFGIHNQHIKVASCISWNHLFVELMEGGCEPYLGGASRVRVCSHVGVQSLLSGHALINLIQPFGHCHEIKRTWWTNFKKLRQKQGFTFQCSMALMMVMEFTMITRLLLIALADRDDCC